MIHQRKLSLLICFLPVLILAGCNYPASTLPTTAPSNPAYTAAAETIIARLTQISEPATGTPHVTAEPATETLQPTEAPTLEATPTLEVTATPTLTATEAAPSPTTSSDPRLQLGEPTWIDTFEDGNNWPLYQDEHVNMKIENERLFMIAFNADGWESWMIARPEIENFYLEVTAQPEMCSGLDRYGIFARAPEPNMGYLFGFTCDGQYSLRKWDGSEYTALVDWTPTQVILAGPDQTNRLGIMARGNQLTLYANGNQMTELSDDSYGKGSFGLFVGAADTPGFTVQYDEIAYWELP